MAVEFRGWSNILNSNRMDLHAIGVFHLGFLFVCMHLSKEMIYFFRDLVAPHLGQKLDIKNGVLGEGHNIFAKLRKSPFFKLWSSVKNTRVISQHFVAFSECMNFTYHCAQLDFIGRLVNVKHHIDRNFAPCISVHSFHSSSAQSCCDDDNESSFLASTVWCMRNVR